MGVWKEVETAADNIIKVHSIVNGEDFLLSSSVIYSENTVIDITSHLGLRKKKKKNRLVYF